MRISDASVEEVGIETVLAEQAGTFMLYYERVLPPLLPPSLLYTESVKTRSSEETVVATPTPPSATRDTTPAHAPERRKRTHSVANNEHEEEKQVKVKVEQTTSADPRPDLRFPLVNGEHMGVEARIIRSTSVGVRSGSQGSRSRSSSVAPPLPRATNGVNVANGHAAAAVAAATVQVPPHTLKVNGVMGHGPPTKQRQSPARKRKKKKSNGMGKGDVNINGAPPRTSVRSESID